MSILQNLTVRGKLLALLVLALISLVLVGLVGNYGIQQGSHSLDSIGHNRLPSIIALDAVNEGQTAVRATLREVPFYENDYNAQEKFANVVKLRDAVWLRIEKNWKAYDALPQEAEEKKVWEQFVPEWNAWKKIEAEQVATITALAQSRSEATQKQLFVKLYQQFEAAKAPFAAAEASLGKVVELNDKYAKDEVARAEAAASFSRLLMLVVGGVAVALTLAASILITRSLLGQLGGEPVYAAEVARRIASGDLSESVNLKTNDTSSMLAAMKSMQQQLTDTVLGIKPQPRRSAAAPSRLPAATPTSPSALKSRPVHWKKRPRAWKNSPARSSKTPRTPSRPISWQLVPAPWQ